ncbi:MAG: MBL fold metallo-hydrolase [Caldilineaceae bacterium]|nr:MBL fold metallo-hydrolase [Caldilineaceae bacterium]
MILKGITVGLYQENCYIFGCEETNQAVVVDPGDNGPAIMKLVAEMGVTVEKIINTHAHLDHVMAVNFVKARTGAPFYLHEADLPVLRAVPDTARLMLSAEVDAVDEPDEFLTHGQIISVGNEELEVRFTPGHAPGHVVFIHHPSKTVLGGDTLFQGSIGRYDLPGADGPTLLQSIREQLFTLDDDYVVYPGHGGATRIGIERIHNPFVGERGQWG